MTVHDILALARAGYTADQINGLYALEKATPVQAPVAAPVQAPVAAPVQAPVAAHVQAPVAAPVQAPVAAPVQAPGTTENTLDALMSQMTALTQTMQKGFMFNAQQPEAHQITLDDITASIIAPPAKEV